MENADPHKYILVNIVAEKKDGQLGIHILHADLTDFSVKDMGSRLDHPSDWFYLLVAMVLSLLIAYSALDYLVLASNPRWLLFLFILVFNAAIFRADDMIRYKVGFYSFASQGQIGMWTFFIPIPIGAIYYWIILRREAVSQEFGTEK